MSGSLAASAVQGISDAPEYRAPRQSSFRAMLGLGDVDRQEAADQARIDKAQRQAEFPKLAAPPPPQTPTDPLQAFGQPAMWLAVFGSLATRRPFANAINAAGQVMHATASLDHDAAKAAYDTWKINNENAFKMAHWEQDMLKNAISQKHTNSQAAASMIKTTYAATENKVLEEIFNREGFAGVEKFFLAGKRRLGEAEAGAKGIDDHMSATTSIVTGWQSNDRMAQADALQKFADTQAALSKTKKGTVKEQMDAQAGAVRLYAAAGDLRSDDPARWETGHKIGAEAIGMGAGVLKAPKEATGGAAASKLRDENTLALDEFKKAHDGRSPGPEDEPEMARLRAVEHAAKPGFTPQMSELMGEMAMRGITLPAGLRSRDQQISAYAGAIAANPGKSMAEIADLIKTAQIELGAQKKETTTAAGVAGRVSVAANELQTMAPLALAASAKVPRGSFLPISKLMQASQNALSDPALKDLQVKTNAMLNAYDMLAARGGTDKEKRQEAHNLLLTANSPEVYAVAIKAFMQEAEAALQAAERAERVRPHTAAAPTEAPKGPPKPAGMTDEALIAAAKARIAAGKPKGPVIEQLRSWGIETGGL